MARTTPKPTPRKQQPPASGIVGDCPAMRDLLRQVRRYAPTSLPALVLGETGTGKELIAREIHRASGRSGRFVAVSCPNLSGTLAESELFGHRRGAFTGAVDHRVGAFEEAHEGTLFLDEIGDMSLDVQARVLRVLQEGTIRRLGDRRETPVDVRVVAATWRDLPKMVADGQFREDLYNRLAFCVVTAPPLRERGHDLVLLAKALLARGHQRHGLPQRSLGRDAVRVLRTHTWPGNVRELERTLYRSMAMSTGRSVTAADLCCSLGLNEDGPATASPAEQVLLDALRTKGHTSAAVLRSQLGVSKSALSRLLAPLIEQGKVERFGAGPSTTYALPKTQPNRSSRERWTTALDIATKEGRVTRAQLAGALGVSERTALRVLGELVNAGKLQADGGRGRAAGYLLTLS
jgi:transcriptional regulator with GAF, ATPase, and Fis domain